MADTSEQPRTFCIGGQKGKPIIGCAKIVIDKPKQSGNMIEDNRRRQLHKSLEEIVAWCSENPDHVLSVLCLMRTNMIQCSSLAPAIKDRGELTDEPFHRTYQSFAKLRKYWMAWFLQKQYPQVFDESRIQLLDRADKQTIKYVFQYALAISDSTAWPAKAHDPSVLYHLCARSAADVAPRITQDWAGAIQDDGVIDWCAVGAYILKPNPDSKGPMILRHRSGSETIMPETITADALHKWDLCHPMSDALASLKCGAVEMRFAAQFAVGVGPRSPQYANSKGLYLNTMLQQVLHDLNTGTLKPMKFSDAKESQMVKSSVDALSKNDSERSEEAKAHRKRQALAAPKKASKQLRVSIPAVKTALAPSS